MHALAIALAFALLTTPPAAAEIREPLNGSASINGCSGALVLPAGRSLGQKALLLTNGHCIRRDRIMGGHASYPAAGEFLYDVETPFLSVNTAINLAGPKGSKFVRAEKLLFATMTGTDVALYQLSPTYQELKELHGIEPLLLSLSPLRSGEEITTHSGFYNRALNCSVDGFASLVEGPYHTDTGVRLSPECVYYNGISGSPILRRGTRLFAALANTSHREGAETQPCGIERPCEVNEATGEKTLPSPGTSYGVPTDFLYLCYSRANGEFNFNLPSCPYRKPQQEVGRAPASFGGRQVPQGDALERTLVQLQNRKSQFCSGAFVAKNVVLTAAHCVVPDHKGEVTIRVGDHAHPMSLPEGIDPLRGAKLRIEEISVHPGKKELDLWVPLPDGDYPFDNPDFALLRLESVYEQAVPAVIMEDSAEGRTLFHAGFGRGNRNWQRPNWNTFHVLKGGFSELAKDYADLRGSKPELEEKENDTDEQKEQKRFLREAIKNTLEFLDGMGKIFPELARYLYFTRTNYPGHQTTCHGDSGGPLFVETKGVVQIYGVASSVYPHPLRGNSSCGGAYLNIFAKTAPHAGWLRAETERLSRVK